MKKIIVWSLMAAILLSFCGCGKENTNAMDTATDNGTETVYMVTRWARYDADGIRVHQVDYQYDDHAQLLLEDHYRIEMFEVYYPEVDILTYTYTADCKLVPYDTAEYGYNKEGNLTKYYSDKLYYADYIYEWDYDDGEPNGYVNMYGEDYTYFGETFFSLEKGRITSQYSIVDGNKRAFALYEYDEEGHLVRECMTFATHTEERKFVYDGNLLNQIVYSSAYGRYNLYDEGWEDALEIVQTQEFEYDKKGNLTEVSFYDEDRDRVEKRTYSYDDKGYPQKMEQTSYLDGKVERSSETYTCDENGNIIKVEYDNGAWVEYTYEAIVVTHQQADYYYRRQNIVLGDYPLHYVSRGAMPDYYMIENPLYDMRYTELLSSIATKTGLSII